MDRKQMCIANVKYKKPTADDSKRTKNLLRYLTYRDGRDDHIKQVSGMERWVDHGLGCSVAEIAHTCDDFRSDHVLAFTLVFNPNPSLVAMIPHDEREQFVKELTETTLDDFFEARDIDTGVEFSYVTHHRHTDDLQAPNQHNPHSHVILPGTIWDEEVGERSDLFFSQNRHVNHIDILHRATEQNMDILMERYVGFDWEQRVDALFDLRDQQQEITRSEAHGHHLADGQAIPFWCGARQVDEDNCAIGYYMPFVDEEGDLPEIQFRPLAMGLQTEYAQTISTKLATMMKSEDFGQADPLFVYVEAVKLLLEDEREDMVQPISNPILNTPSVTPDFDL